MRQTDQVRVDECRRSIGAASWSPFGNIFGDPQAVLSYMPRYSARMINFKVPAKQQEDAVVAVGN